MPRSSSQQFIYVYMASSPSIFGRVRYLKLGHGYDPKARMMDYTGDHTYKKYHFSFAAGFSKNKGEKKPIRSSLRVWGIKGGISEAKRIEAELAWYLHDELELENKYLSVLRLKLDGKLPKIYRTTKSGDLIWHDAKELHYLGLAESDKSEPNLGPTAKFNNAVNVIDQVLRSREWILE